MQQPAEIVEETAAHPSGSPLNTILTLVLVGIVAVGGWMYFGPKSAMAGWNKDWDSAVAQSKTSGKPAVVLFTADWCPPCKTLKSETLSDSRVKAALAAGFTPVVVDLTDRAGPNNRIAQEYGVQGIPTVILFDSAGREKKRTHGMDAGSFVAWLNSR